MTNHARLRAIAPPLVVGVGGLALWELVLTVLNPKAFVLPRPSVIAGKVVEQWSTIVTATTNTGFIAVTGLIAGALLGIMVAILVSRFQIVSEAVTPLAVAVNAIPIIALAPIFNFWFGLRSPRSNQGIVVLLVFFPVFVNSVRGLTEVHRGQLDLMESFAASTWETLKEVRIPNALPYLFTSLKIASSLAVIAAIVAEYFGGDQAALGQLIVQQAALSRYSSAWAGVLAGTLMGMALYLVVVVLERWFMPWRVTEIERSGS
ncbi:Pyrimidine ABC transporter, transmembrane component 1 [hydrothermal vent metagenome]|uniref:Pyrimidine ABC transporter, transmembrane component 1 n=1 Tax=hydrothermal vent metagenome TaxID=652676 RepID=A0A3B0SX23_9ZZZZ